MHFFKHALFTLFITFSALVLVGCDSGEADYSFEEVTSHKYVEDLINGTITFITEEALVVQENQSDVTVLKVDANQDVVYSIVGGTDQELFTIDERTGQLSFINPPSYVEGLLNIYDVIVGITTASGELSTLPMLITIVKDITKTAPSIDYVVSNIETVVGVETITQIQARPADESSSLTYALVGTDAELFQIDENGNISFKLPLPDIETALNEQYTVSAVVTDGYGNSIITEPIVITVVANPDLISPVIETQAASVVENSLGAVQIEVTALGSGTVNSYVLGGTDASYFNVTSTGVLGFNEARDFETLPTTFNITMQVGDDKGNVSDVETIVVSVKDIDEQFTFQNIADFTPMEGDKTVGQITATPNTLSSVTTQYTLLQDVDLLEIDSEGNIQFTALAQQGQNVTAQIRVESQLNGSQTLSQSFTVTVVDDPSKIPPVINQSYPTSNAVTAPVDTAQAILTVQAAPEGSSTTLSYTTSGADADKFIVDENGNLFFASSYDYDLALDANGDNIYEVVVTVTDDNDNSVSTQLITVELLEDPNTIVPVITSSTFSLNENIVGDLVIQISAPGNGIVNSYTVLTGGDSALFDFDNGRLSFKSTRDFETPLSMTLDNSYHVTLQVSDDLGNVSTAKEIIVNIQDVDESLEFTTLSSFTHVEGTSEIGTIAASPKLVMSTDITYSIGEGSTLFTIDETSGLLSFKTVPVYDGNSNNDYTLSVIAQSQYNGSLTESGTITVTVMPMSYAITFDYDQSTAYRDQNTVVTFPMTAASAADELLTYSLDEGYDATIFSINASTGYLTINAPAYIFSNDTEANTYRAAVVASDTKGNSARRQGILYINEVDGLPRFTSLNTRVVSENIKVLNSVSAYSPIGSPITYTIDGGADSGLFSISATGTLAFTYAQNFEDPQDQNRDNVYEVNVRVTDTLHSVNSVLQTIYVTVTNVYDAPSNIVFESTNTSSVSVDDGTLIFLFSKNTVSYERLKAVASPSNGALSYSIVSNPDSSIFSISSSGELKIDAPRFSSNQLFTVTVGVSEEKGEYSEQTLFVTILD